MKEFRSFLTVQAIVVMALLTILFITAASHMDQELDTVAANDLVQTVKEHWEDLTALDQNGMGAGLMVFDREGKVVYSFPEEAFQEIHSPLDAMREHLITMPVYDEEVFLGTLAFFDPGRIGYDHRIYKIIMVVFFAALILLLSYAAFLFYIYRHIIRPFRRMKRYAALIAQGKLDEPLIMDRTNIFGIFTESFDTMREELKASRDRELALKLKEKELVASLSHDLKTPVTGIKLVCELLEVKIEDEYIRGKIAGIEHKTDQMDVLLNNLLSSVLEELGEMNVNCSEVTSDILADLLEEHDPRKKVMAEEVPGCIIHVDKNRLSQVIGNILSNSYKYADTPIHVSYRFHEKYLEMSILDHGPGVGQEEVPLLTNKFYRGRNHASETEGSGLGLYISKELMEKMKGQLACRSGEEGFCVTLWLPLA